MLAINSLLSIPGNLPALIAFRSSQGVEIGRPVRWLGKAWMVATSRGGCFVMPEQVLWAE